MTLDELSEHLRGLKAGQKAGLHHDVYAELFPPGEPDEGARGRCYGFAKALGCRIENKPNDREIWFVKDS